MTEEKSVIDDVLNMKWIDPLSSEFLQERITFRVGGYAKGHYVGPTCTDCGITMYNVDKRAFQCFPCAVKELIERHECAKSDISELEKNSEKLLVKYIRELADNIEKKIEAV